MSGGAQRKLARFFVDSLYLGIDAHGVQEVLNDCVITRVPLAPDVIAGLTNLRGEIITAFDLRRVFGLPAREDDAASMIVVRKQRRVLGMLVDRVVDVFDVAPEAIERTPDTLRGVARELVVGVCKLDTGLLLLLDVDKATDERARVLEPDAAPARSLSEAQRT